MPGLPPKKNTPLREFLSSPRILLGCSVRQRTSTQLLEVDGVFIGPMDLSCSLDEEGLGTAGPKTSKAIARIKALAHRQGKVVGTLAAKNKVVGGTGDRIGILLIDSITYIFRHIWNLPKKLFFLFNVFPIGFHICHLPSTPSSLLPVLGKDFRQKDHPMGDMNSGPFGPLVVITGKNIFNWFLHVSSFSMIFHDRSTVRISMKN